MLLYVVNSYREFPIGSPLLLPCIVGSITVPAVELSLQSIGLGRKNLAPRSWHISWHAVGNLELDRWKINHLPDEFESLPLRHLCLAESESHVSAVCDARWP